MNKPIKKINLVSILIFYIKDNKNKINSDYLFPPKKLIKITTKILKTKKDI